MENAVYPTRSFAVGGGGGGGGILGVTLVVRNVRALANRQIQSAYGKFEDAAGTKRPREKTSNPWQQQQPDTRRSESRASENCPHSYHTLPPKPGASSTQTCATTSMSPFFFHLSSQLDDGDLAPMPTFRHLLLMGRNQGSFYRLISPMHATHIIPRARTGGPKNHLSVAIPAHTERCLTSWQKQCFKVTTSLPAILKGGEVLVLTGVLPGSWVVREKICDSQTLAMVRVTEKDQRLTTILAIPLHYVDMEDALSYVKYAYGVAMEGPCPIEVDEPVKPTNQWAEIETPETCEGDAEKLS
ncbi:hypothetical protein DFH06DRAFT_1130939 [Mycena polygramma]|nr:hypothetical protein DFH06DRAFT_1130939 [Mycena polygramma]